MWLTVRRRESQPSAQQAAALRETQVAAGAAPLPSEQNRVQMVDEDEEKEEDS